MVTVGKVEGKHGTAEGGSMKRLLSFVCVLWALAYALPSHGEPGKNYVAVKPGAYYPRASDLRDGDFDPGFNGEIVIGRRINSNLAVEMGLGYFHAEATYSSAGSYYEQASLFVVPATLSIKGILPFDKLELFGVGGVGAYYVHADNSFIDSVSSEIGSLSASDLIFGGHIGAGLHYNITPDVFVGAEGKYLWTSNVKLLDSPLKFKMDGIIGTAVVGFRF